MGTCEYTPSGLDVAEQKWSGAGTGGDSGLTNAKSVVFTEYHISFRIPARIPNVLVLLCELALAKREPCSHIILLAFLIKSSRFPGNIWTWRSSARALVIKAQAKCVLWKNFNKFWVHHHSLCSHVVLFMLKPALWSRHCQVLHYEGLQSWLFCYVPIPNWKKGICPQGKREVSYRLSSSLYHPLPHMAFEPTYTKFPLPSTYVPEHSPTSNYSSPEVVCPLLRIIFQLYVVWIQWRK